jgi:serine protease Do
LCWAAASGSGDERLERDAEEDEGMMMERRPSGFRAATSAVGLLLLVALLGSCLHTQDAAAAKQPRRAPCAKSIPAIFDRVSPAVLFIAATSINPYQLTNRVIQVVGSGFFFDPSGLILTSSHVVFGRQSIVVTLDDGTSLPAHLVGADPIFDLAVLRVSPPPEQTLVIAALGDSDRVRVGEEVVAIGNPLGLDQTLTRGIVSSINRILPETPFSVLMPLIQTDTPINPGNSGGPLLNRCGEVIGISTAVIAEAENIGFVIPINLAKAVLPSLLTYGRVIRPWLGFHGQLIDNALTELLRMPLVGGLLVEVIEPGSPAEQAGLRGGRLELAIAGHEFLLGGDIITHVNGIRLDSPETLLDIMRTLTVGSMVRLQVFRDGTDETVEYVLPERPVLLGDIQNSRVLNPLVDRRERPSSPQTLWPRR